MNYLTLINQFWTLRREVSFSSTEADLYYYLLNVANGLKWKNPFQQANLLICATLGISEKPLIAARNRLKQYGLIDFTPGVKRNPSTYKLLLLENTLENIQPIREESGSVSGSESGSESGSVFGANPPDINKHKQEVNKTPPTQGAGEFAAPSASPSLNAEKKLVPPVAQPPREIAAESSGSQHSAAAKALAAEMAKLWSLSPMPSGGRKWAQLHRFTHHWDQLGKLAEVSRQFTGYALYRQKRDIEPIGLDKFLGNEADGFQGEWCQTEWPDKARQAKANGVTTHLGQPLPTPNRGGGSPSRAAAHKPR